MAGPQNPFEPGVDANALMDETLAPIGQQIQSFVNDPRGRAALLQFGIQAAQPLAWGQGGGAGIMSAIGAGGEAVGREDALRRKDEEVATKQQIADARSDAVSARAGASAQAASHATERLNLTRQQMEMQDKFKSLTGALNLQKTYETARKNNAAEAMKGITIISTEPEKAAAKAKIDAFPASPQDWAAKNPGAAAVAAGLLPEGSMTPTAPAAAKLPTATGPGGKKMVYKNGAWQDQTADEE